MSRDQQGEIATKAAVAGAFFFVLQFVVLKATLETSIMWAVGLAAAAGLLSWSQIRRGR